MKKTCPKCGVLVKLTRHHIFPKRHFGKGRQNSAYFWLCRGCHDSLERIIPFKRMPRKFYSKIIETFLKGG